ncbi:MAG: hypothetical protein GY708_28380 [Actinomycetia bacterium]|nr:hypothetical protein [Actinomycetes bacterium]
MKTKIEQARGKLKLLPGEEVIGGCSSADGATTQHVRATDLGGHVGRVLARHRVGRPPDHRGKAHRFPSGSFLVCLTTRHLLVTNISTPSNNPTRTIAAYPKDDVIAIISDDGDDDGLNRLGIAFSDGTAVRFPICHDATSSCLPELFLEW